jgi:anti-sigma B factor antagonist
MEDVHPIGMVLRTTTPRPGVVLVAVAGECDLHDAPRLEGALSEARTGGSRVLLDLSELRFLDSTTLGVLVKSKRLLEEAGCELVLLAPSREVRRTVSLAGVDRVFTILDAETHDEEVAAGANGNGHAAAAEPRLRKTTTMFRAVNERICELTRSWDVDEIVYFVCECDDERCTRPVGLSTDEFQRIISSAEQQAIVHPDHADNVSHVLESGEEYLVVTGEESLAH